MKLVFFDIECANIRKNAANICAFGYVISDENFAVTAKEDILINPRCKFRLDGKQGKRELVLPYDYSEFKKYPAFYGVYPKIKEILEDGDSLIFGHSVTNDVRFLNRETRRYGLKPLRFSFWDTQIFYMAHTGDYNRQRGLGQIADELGVEFTPHRAADDAYATMKTAEAFCKTYGCGIRELFGKLKAYPGKTAGGRMIYPTTDGLKKYREAALAAREKRLADREKFNANLSEKEVSQAGGVLKGKIITFSRAIEDDIEFSIPLVDKIYSEGGRYTSSVNGCNLYVSAENDNSLRSQHAQNGSKPRMTVESFEEILNGTAR